ncbi:MAG TPA: glycoside hydrolase family 6 protein [Polyangiaceae bacterium]|nr:glycoside hydrolase family 6 protein [Polyangiaceae bacterium]
MTRSKWLGAIGILRTLAACSSAANSGPDADTGGAPGSVNAWGGSGSLGAGGTAGAGAPGTAGNGAANGSGFGRPGSGGRGEPGGGSGGDDGGGTSNGGASSSGGGSENGTSGPFVPPPSENPFAGAAFYLSADYAGEVQTSMDADPSNAALLSKVKSISTAVWLDRIARVPDASRHLDAAKAQEAAAGEPVVTVFVVYDLPNRDCAAKASNGELAVESGGLDRYEHEYIDAIHAAFAAHGDQRIVAIVEPDSLPNLATNMNQPKCAASADAYRQGVAYAIRTLSAPNVFLYLDAAHSGWLGWPNNQTATAQIFKEVLDAAGGAEKIRGFATNTANYSVLRETTELFDYQGNPCHDELTFVSQFTNALANAGISGKGFIVDTSRNGRGGIRHAWGNWCNVVGAGMGERPVADPVAGVDAYYWVKPPGESDGTSDASAVRYDSFCGNEDAAKPAPEAGTWFDSYFRAVAKNANPPL